MSEPLKISIGPLPSSAEENDSSLPRSVLEVGREVDQTLSKSSEEKNTTNAVPSATSPLDELIKENERLRNANIELRNKQLMEENARLKAMTGMMPGNFMMPQAYSYPWYGQFAPPAPPPGYSYPDGMSPTSQESQSFSSGNGQSFTSSFGSSYGAHVEQDQSYDPTKSPLNMPTECLTTVMMRHIPNNYSREQVFDLLEANGYGTTFDLLYLPIDFEKRNGLGYAFINFKTHEQAERFRDEFSGFCEWDANSDKICQVTWSSVLQGLPAHIERYRNSPVMHESVPDEFKPMLFDSGRRVQFPPPSKRIRPPHQWRPK